jgi:hypothetical protein
MPVWSQEYGAALDRGDRVLHAAPSAAVFAASAEYIAVWFKRAPRRVRMKA